MYEGGRKEGQDANMIQDDSYIIRAGPQACCLLTGKRGDEVAEERVEPKSRERPGERAALGNAGGYGKHWDYL
jgi:hypothetical protein